jgi:hypothetical protein
MPVMDRMRHWPAGATRHPAPRRRGQPGELVSHRSRLAELLILCARIGFNP